MQAMRYSTQKTYANKLLTREKLSSGAKPFNTYSAITLRTVENVCEESAGGFI